MVQGQNNNLYKFSCHLPVYFEDAKGILQKIDISPTILTSQFQSFCVSATYQCFLPKKLYEKVPLGEEKQALWIMLNQTGANYSFKDYHSLFETGPVLPSI